MPGTDLVMKMISHGGSNTYSSSNRSINSSSNSSTHSSSHGHGSSVTSLNVFLIHF